MGSSSGRPLLIIPLLSVVTVDFDIDIVQKKGSQKDTQYNASNIIERWCEFDHLGRNTLDFCFKNLANNI